PRDQREALRQPDQHRLRPAERRELAVVMWPLVGTAALHELDAIEDAAIEDERNRDDVRGGKEALQRLLEQEAEETGGNRAHHEQPAEPGVSVVTADFAVAQRAQDAQDDLHPVAPE